MAGNFVRGSLVSFTPTFLFSTPSVIVFQFNPETITHDWSEQKGDDKTPALSVKGDPEESFSFTLKLDSDEIIADRKPTEALARTTGISTRLAALESLQFPVNHGTAQCPNYKLPLVLFIWGVGRILPVRITTLKVDEKEYDDVLNPTKADVTIGLRVLREDEIQEVPKDVKEIATTTKKYAKKLREGLVAANAANAIEGRFNFLF